MEASAYYRILRTTLHTAARNLMECLLKGAAWGFLTSLCQHTESPGPRPPASPHTLLMWAVLSLIHNSPTLGTLVEKLRYFRSAYLED